AIALEPRSGTLLAVDQEAAALLAIRPDSQARVIQRVELSADPISVVVTPDGRACVASRSSRTLTIVDRTGEAGLEASWKVATTIGLPFSPRNLALVGKDTLIVADAYGGNLAVVNLSQRTLARVRSLPGHNIRGLTVTPDGRALIVAHQQLLGNAQTTYEDIHWGLFVNNDLRVLEVDRLLGSG